LAKIGIMAMEHHETYKVRTKKFYQFYILLGEKNGHMFPCDDNDIQIDIDEDEVNQLVNNLNLMK